MDKPLSPEPSPAEIVARKVEETRHRIRRTQRERETQRSRDQVKQIFEVHAQACKKFDAALAAIREAVHSAILVEKAISVADLDPKLRLSYRLRLPVTIREFLVAQTKLSTAAKVSHTISSIQKKEIDEILSESEPDFE